MVIYLLVYVKSSAFLTYFFFFFGYVLFADAHTHTQRKNETPIL